LRGAITAGASGLGPILNTIAEAAQTLTAATGSALALRRGGMIVCCARSGETAPELGARVSEDSGISGECMRTGKVLRCDDTQKDYRVNPEACRRLGIHSIAVVPLCGPEQVTGLLEVFSTRPYAFNDEHVSLLSRLADLAQAAQRRDVVGDTQAVPAAAAQPVSVPQPAPVARPALATVVPRLLEYLRDQRSRSLIVGAALVILALVVAWGWVGQSKPRKSVPVAQKITPQASSVEDLAMEPPTEVVVKPSPNRPAENPVEHKERPSKRASKEDSSAKASPEGSAEAPDTVTHSDDSDASDAPLIVAHNASRAAASETADSPVEQPALTEPKADGSTLAGVLVAPSMAPSLARPVSQGVTPGKLIHQVQPVYPRQAQTLQLAGPVVLDAAIGVDGKVGRVKIVSGHPILARAAIDAVRQWRYTPYRLDGKPIVANAQITVNFVAQ
jgi:TonB family protein